MTVTTLPTAHTAPPVATPTLDHRVTTAYTPAPAGTSADLPRVFAVIHGVMRDVMPVGKDKDNHQQNYKFRGVDDAMSAMAGPMRNHGCFIAPEVIEHKQRPRGEKGTHTVLTMLYRIYGPAGDCLAVTIPGEAMDTADKSTNKAMSAALKYMLFQVFMIPVDARSIDDGDRDHPVMSNTPQQRQQPQRRPQQPQRGQRGQQRRPQQEQPQQRQRRDYAAEARQAKSEEEFAAIRKAAEEAGAPPEYIVELDAIATRKRSANGTPQQSAPRNPAPAPAPAAPAADQAPATAPPAANTATAEEALRLAASRANLRTLDADFERVYGVPIVQASAVQMHAFRKKIEGNAA